MFQPALPSSSFSTPPPGVAPLRGAEAVPDNPFLSQWQDCSTHRLIRDVGGEVLDAHVPAPKIASAAIDKLVAMTEPLTKHAKDYGDLLNWQDYEVELGPKKQFQTTSDVLKTKAGWTKLKNAAYLNFGSTSLPNMTPRQIVKEIVIGDNIRTITEPLSQGRFFTGLFRTGWLGLGAIPVFQRTKQAYQTSQSGYQAAKTFLKESSKALGAWEFGTVGAIVGGLLLPVGWAATLGKAVMMGLFSTSAHEKLDRWLP